MNELEDFTAPEYAALVDYYNQFNKWQLIKRVIELEHRDTLRDMTEGLV